VIVDLHTHIVPEQFPDSVVERWPHMEHIEPGRANVMIAGKNFRTVRDVCWHPAKRAAEMENEGADAQAISPMPELLSKLIAQASVVVGKGTFVSSVGFLWVEDPNVRDMLRSRRQTAELFIDPSPPGGLLVQPMVDVERLARRCRTLGVEIAVDGQVMRVRSTAPPSSIPPSIPPSTARRSSSRPRQSD